MSIQWSQSRVHSLNNSKSKQAYAFPKQSRFPPSFKPLCDNFYEIARNSHRGRAASIGKGSKMTFEDKYKYPSPLQYKIKSIFDNKNKGIKLSVGRQNIKYGGIFQKSQTPDPSHYNPNDSRLKSAQKGYSMRSRLKQQQYSNAKNPGPGQYNSVSSINATGIYNISNYSNCMCPKIKSSKVYNPLEYIKTPGPGQYERKENMSQTGKYFISKYPDSRCRSFSKSSQYSLVKKGSQKLPGPGSYNYYSEFGARNKIL